MAEGKAMGHLSYLVATLRQPLSLLNRYSIRSRRLWRRLSCQMGFFLPLQLGSHAFILLSFKGSLMQVGIIAPVSQHPFCLLQTTQHGSCTGVMLAGPATTNMRIGYSMKLCVHAVLRAPYQPAPLFLPAGWTPCDGLSGSLHHP